MALILEVERAGGARDWRRLDGEPLTVGRGLANDVILDDPYVDARHVRLAPDGAGGWTVEDLGSVNGVWAGDAAAGPTRAARVRVAAGDRVRVGRTVLRFRDPHEDVGPALVDAEPGAARRPAREQPRVAGSRPATSPAARLGVVAVATALVALNTHLNNADRSSASDVLAGALAFLGLAVVWAGLWAVAGRVVVQRAHFLGHLALAAGVAGVALAASELGEWLAFLFPDGTLAGVVAPLLFFALVVTLVAGHLALGSAMAPRRRWRAGVVTAAALFGIGLASAYAGRDDFTTVPTFSGVLKPVDARWVPTASVDDFGGVMRDLRRDVDELAAAVDKADAAGGAPDGPASSAAARAPAQASR